MYAFHKFVDSSFWGPTFTYFISSNQTTINGFVQAPTGGNFFHSTPQLSDYLGTLNGNGVYGELFVNEVVANGAPSMYPAMLAGMTAQAPAYRFEFDASTNLIFTPQAGVTLSDVASQNEVDKSASAIILTRNLYGPANPPKVTDEKLFIGAVAQLSQGFVTCTSVVSIFEYTKAESLLPPEPDITNNSVVSANTVLKFTVPAGNAIIYKTTADRGRPGWRMRFGKSMPTSCLPRCRRAVVRRRLKAPSAGTSLPSADRGRCLSAQSIFSRFNRWDEWCICHGKSKACFAGDGPTSSLLSVLFTRCHPIVWPAVVGVSRG